jgi:hypothetical protein
MIIINMSRDVWREASMVRREVEIRGPGLAIRHPADATDDQARHSTAGCAHHGIPPARPLGRAARDRRASRSSRYKAILIDKDSYLLELSRYVHVNPVRVRSYQAAPAGEQMRYLKSYRWSSLSGYVYSQQRQFWVNYHNRRRGLPSEFVGDRTGELKL